MEALSLCIIAPRDPPQNQASSITDKIKSKLDKDNSIISCSAILKKSIIKEKEEMNANNNLCVV